MQGQTDIPLTDEASATLETLKMPHPWNTARLYSSPLLRAKHTASLLSDGRSVRHDARFIEMSWGEWEGALAKDLILDPSSGFRPTHEWDRDTKAPGGESMRDAWERARPALAEIAADPEPAVVVMHKALMRVIMGTACDWQFMPEIKRGRLYPISVRSSGLPRDLGDAIRLEPRAP